MGKMGDPNITVHEGQEPESSGDGEFPYDPVSAFDILREENTEAEKKKRE